MSTNRKLNDQVFDLITVRPAKTGKHESSSAASGPSSPTMPSARPMTALTRGCASA